MTTCFYARLIRAPLLSGLALGLGAAVVLGYGAVCRSEAAEVTSSPTGTAEAALATYVRLTGGTFVGPCEQTRSPDDVGKTCDRLVEEWDNQRAYLLGRTFSEFTTWVFLKQDGSGWTVQAIVPVNFRDTTRSIPWPP